MIDNCQHFWLLKKVFLIHCSFLLTRRKYESPSLLRISRCPLTTAEMQKPTKSELRTIMVLVSCNDEYQLLSWTTTIAVAVAASAVVVIRECWAWHENTETANKWWKREEIMNSFVFRVFILMGSLIYLLIIKNES